MKNFKEFKKDNNVGYYIQDILNQVTEEQREFLLQLIGQYLKPMQQLIDLPNAINVLDNIQQRELQRRVKLYLKNNQGEVKVQATINQEEVLQEAFKENVLATFFKCLTALGLKENNPSSEHKKDFLFLYWFPDLKSDQVQLVFNRFKSIGSIEIDWEQPKISLFFGLNNLGIFQYGYTDIHDELVAIGEFKLTNSTLKMLKKSDMKANSNLRKLLAPLSLKEIELALQIRKALQDYLIESAEETGILFQEKILTKAYLGVGEELENVREDFKKYLQKFKWSDKILVSVKANNLWLYLQIKIK